MFTEGLDESALNWVKKGSDAVEQNRNQTRLPLTETLDLEYPLPKSPLSYNSTAYKSSNVLPPLKFHSGLLGSHNAVSLTFDNNEDSDYEEDGDESVASASVSVDLDCNYSEAEGLDEEIFGLKSSENLNPSREARPNGHNRSTLNRGVLKEDLCVEVPQNIRRFTDTELGFGASASGGLVSNGSHRLQPRSAYGTPMSQLGTPSAPPILEERGGGDRFEVHSESSKDSVGLMGTDKFTQKMHITEEIPNGLYSNDDVSRDTKADSPKIESGYRENEVNLERTEASLSYQQPNSPEHSPYYNNSGQNAWQTLIAYDACIRLCLNAWARGCTEAPEFLSDECRLLRNAFRLHKFLLQPRGVKSRPMNTIKSTEQVGPLKMKKVIGKIRVEVKKVRIIPRRKLKSTYSQQSAMYMQVGVEYIRHFSSLVKNGINSLGLSSFSLAFEGCKDERGDRGDRGDRGESIFLGRRWLVGCNSYPGSESLAQPMSCMLHLKSSKEDTETEPTSAICLKPGTGEYHDFFPENQGDAVLLEVQDAKKAIQGRAIIPVSSLNDNPSDRIKWWPIYHDDLECIGKAQLSIISTVACEETSHQKSGPVVETLAYDLLLEAAMHAQHFHARNLWVVDPWKWLLKEFADYYGVSESYTKLRYLSHVMIVATPTRDCLELIHEFLVPVMKDRYERRLTRQEKSLLLDCETHIESLLAHAFENYKSLDETSSTGLTDVFYPIPEVAAPALAPSVQLYTLLHDILAQDAQTMLSNYLQTAARKRCRKHMVETDEFVSSNSDGFLMDHIAITTAYLKMKNLCMNLSNEIRADIKIHNQHVLPSSIDLSSITASVYSSELCKRLRGFLSAWPPSSPQPHVNELLIATADFERNLESWNISVVQGGVDSRNLFHNYIMVWIQDMQLSLLDLCKGEKVPWAGVITNYSTSPFAEEVYDKVKEMLTEYEVVINRWPQYTLILENAVANVERALLKALEKQYADILTPLKDSIPQRLGIQVQKLTRRQSTTHYSIPNQLGTFLNTIKRIVDVLHCRIEDKLKSWASFLPVSGDKKSTYGEQMNGITVIMRTKYKNYMQAIVIKLTTNMQATRGTRLQRILEETKEADGEAEVRERMQALCSQLIESISNLHEVFTTQIFIASCRWFWDKMGQVVLKFLEGRKENRVWYNGSYYALGILDDTFASQMQRLQGNALQDKDLEPPRSIIEARSILCRDATNAADTSTYLYF